MAVGRVRTAWVLAKAELEKAAKAVVAGAPEADWDAPLDETEGKTLQEAFHTAYDNLSFDTESTPGPLMVGRHFREFKAPARNMTKWPLKRVRTAAECGMQPNAKRQRLTEETVQVHCPDLRLRSFCPHGPRSVRQAASAEPPRRRSQPT